MVFESSVDTNLMVYVDYLSKALERGVGVDTDFSKAFDNVDHCLLLNKFYNYGKRGDMLNSLSSYLKGRIK